MKPLLADLGLVTKGDEHAWAVTSEDDAYRYALGRMWDDYFDDGRDWWDRDPIRALWVFCMLNPSKARHDVDDPTMRKCVGFAKRGGAGGILIVNLFAYSATYVKDLVQARRDGVDVVGAHNEAVLQWAFSRPALLGRNIVAWGKIPPRLRVAAQRPRSVLMRKAECLGLNGDGTPKHPLMPGYDTPIVPFIRPDVLALVHS